MVLFGPLILLSVDKSEWCSEYRIDTAESKLTGNSSQDNAAAGGNDDTAETNEDEDPYENPDYITDPCRYVRVPQLMMLTLEECDLSRRMLASVLFGGAIGYERRSSDRPAGIRTMGLVSLGSCFFTISSMLAFKSSTMGWDSSRVTAAIPSGVGFLGAGLIWKGTIGSGDEEMHQVHGLTTAASVWLSAAVGVGAGGAMYFVSAYSVVLVTLILRYGPKLYLQDDSSYRDENDDDTDTDSGFSTEEDLSDHPNDAARGTDDERRENASRDEVSAGECDESLESFSQGFLSPSPSTAYRKSLVDTTRAANLLAESGEDSLKSERDTADDLDGSVKHVHGPFFAMQSDLTGPSLSSFAVGYDYMSSSVRSIPGGPRRRSLTRGQPPQQQQHVQFGNNETGAGGCPEAPLSSRRAAMPAAPPPAPSTPKRSSSAATVKKGVKDGRKSPRRKSAEKKRRHKKSSAPSFHS